MNKTLDIFVLPHVTIFDALNKLETSLSKERFPGFLIVLDKDSRIVGSVTDGDIRRALIKGLGITEAISNVMNKAPLMIDNNASNENIENLLGRPIKGFIDHHRLPIIIRDSDGTFVDLVYLNDLLRTSLEVKEVAIYGLGYVGLTLAVAFANSGIFVIGIDKSDELLTKLNAGEPSFHEINFAEQLSQAIRSGRLVFEHISKAIHSRFRIVTVGTPVNAADKPDSAAIASVTKSLSRDLRPGDLVTYRSTLPIGATRQLMLPIIEEHSQLRVGRDVWLSFAPERTIEGDALKELQFLPQIVGGYDDKSAKLTGNLYKKITQTIVEVESLEAAELVKLVNNAFRDHVFAFSNELALLCNSLNIDPYGIIHAANEGYPRNKVPFPSPGVGGACLTKDPFLYSSPLIKDSYKLELPQRCRSIHRRMKYLVSQQLERFADATARSMADLEILSIGMAFKGDPETSDLRGSSGVEIASLLSKRVKKQYIYDIVSDLSSLSSIGIPVMGRLEETIIGVDAVLFLNNHPGNRKIEFLDLFSKNKKERLIFDGWNQFSRSLLEGIDYLHYANLGYYTRKTS